METDGRELSLGVIGMGKMGLLHASIINALPGARVTAMFEKNRMMVRYARRAFPHICVTDDLDTFAATGLDAVFVTTPIRTHHTVIASIFERHIARHVFTEKTLAASADQAADLCRLAGAAGGVTMVGYMSRFAPTFRKARELLRGGSIGTPVSFEARAYASDFAGVDRQALPDKGGATRDLGAHVIDLSLWFFGNLQIEAGGEQSPEITEFSVKGSGGVTGDYEISWCREGYRLPEWRLSVTGSDGHIEVDQDLVRLRNGAGERAWRRPDLETAVPYYLGAPEYYWEDETFVNAVRNGTSAETDFVAAAKVDTLIEQAERQVVA